MSEVSPGYGIDFPNTPTIGPHEAKALARADEIALLNPKLEEIWAEWHEARARNDDEAANRLRYEAKKMFDYKTSIQNGIDYELRVAARADKIQKIKAAVGHSLDLRRLFRSSSHDTAAETLIPAVENSRLTGSDRPDILI